MTLSNIQKLHEILDTLVNGEGPSSWRARRDWILQNTSEGERITLEEFVSWFEEAK